MPMTLKMMLKINATFTMIGLALSDAADDCPDCTRETVGKLGRSTVCETVVARDQVKFVYSPAIVYSDVKSKCPKDKFGRLHMEVCDECRAMHMPCNRTFAACPGCCGHGVPAQHKCSEIQSFYRYANHATCKLEEPSIDLPEQNTDTASDHKMSFDLVEPIFQKQLTSTCEVDVEQVLCERHPVLIDFNCTQCILGNPDLLRQCCDAGLEFSESDDLRTIPFIAPFVVLHGCHIEEMEYEHKGVIKKQPFVHREKYANFTVHQQQKSMDDWVAEHVCPLFPEPPACPSDRRLSGEGITDMNCEPLPEEPDTIFTAGFEAAGAPDTASSGVAVGNRNSATSGGAALDAAAGSRQSAPGGKTAIPAEAPLDHSGDSGDIASTNGVNVSSSARCDLSSTGFILFLSCIHKMF